MKNGKLKKGLTIDYSVESKEKKEVKKIKSQNTIVSESELNELNESNNLNSTDFKKKRKKKKTQELGVLFVEEENKDLFEENDNIPFGKRKNTNITIKQDNEGIFEKKRKRKISKKKANIGVSKGDFIKIDENFVIEKKLEHSKFKEGNSREAPDEDFLRYLFPKIQSFTFIFY